ncbi:MAG: hypothetical protein WBB45_21255 [Cyclobacteriaceae bacterium]
MIIEEKKCKVEIGTGNISCRYTHPLRKKAYGWDLEMKNDELIYRSSGRTKRIYDIESLEEFVFEVGPVSKKKLGAGHKATAYVKVRGELSAVKICRLMIQDSQADASETKTYQVMDKVINRLSERYNIPGSYSSSVLTKDKLNKLLKGVIIVSGVLLAFIVMALLTE